jgi:hypothetical protein
VVEAKETALPRKDELGDETLKALAHRVVEAYAELDEHLGKGHFPTAEFDKLRHAVFDYAMAMQESDWLHRNVANVVSGLRDYLQLDCHNAPSDILWKIDQMETLIFCGYDAYPDQGGPSSSDSSA